MREPRRGGARTNDMINADFAPMGQTTFRDSITQGVALG
jgi:hypothetical protein